MKIRTFFLSFLLLFLTGMVFTSCEKPEVDSPEIENLDVEIKIYGVDKDIERPGNQGSSGS